MILEEYQVLEIQMTQHTGVYKFKKGFNGEFTEFVDELYMVFDPFINTLFNITRGNIYKVSNYKR